MLPPRLFAHMPFDTRLFLSLSQHITLLYAEYFRHAIAHTPLFRHARRARLFNIMPRYITLLLRDATFMSFTLLRAAPAIFIHT